MNDDHRLIEWIDLTADLLLQPRPVFPRSAIGLQFSRTFDVLAVSWDWREVNGSSAAAAWP